MPENFFLVTDTLALPTLFAPNPDAGKRFIEFFTANIRNPNTRKVYARAAVEFAAWCENNGLTELQDIEPVHVAIYIETLQTRLAAPSVKLHLAAIRMLFDWLVTGQVIAMNPASSVRGPRYSTKKGKTPVLAADEARTLPPVSAKLSPLIWTEVMNLTRYTPAFKEEAVRKMLTRGERTIADVAAELNVPYHSIRNWLRNPNMAHSHRSPSGEKRVQNWSVEQRFQALLDTNNLSVEELNAWCRERGVFAHQLQAWRAEFCTPVKPATDAAEVRKLKGDLVTLQRELNRKEKALSEAAALLCYKKSTRRCGRKRTNDFARTAPEHHAAD